MYVDGWTIVVPWLMLDNLTPACIGAQLYSARRKQSETPQETPSKACVTVFEAILFHVLFDIMLLGFLIHAHFPDCTCKRMKTRYMTISSALGSSNVGESASIQYLYPSVVFCRLPIFFIVIVAALRVHSPHEKCYL